MARPAPRVAPATSATRPVSGAGAAVEVVIRPASRRPPTQAPTERGTGAYSTGHGRLLDGARAPTERGTRAYSTGHGRLLDGARAPTERGTSAYSTGHGRLPNGVGGGSEGRRLPVPGAVPPGRGAQRAVHAEQAGHPRRPQEHQRL